MILDILSPYHPDHFDPADLGWTHDVSAEAQAEGWDLFSCHGSDYDSWQIQRIDSPDDDDVESLEDDNVAWRLIKSQQKRCHRVALEIIKILNPDEFVRILES